MSLRVLPSASICLLLCSSLARPAVAQAPAATAALVEPPGVTSFELSNTTPIQEVVVPLTPRAGVADLAGRIIRVNVGDQPRPGLNGPFAAAVRDGNQLHVTATYGRIHETGTFTVVVQLAGTVAPDGGKAARGHQELVLQLVLPSPRLRAIPSIVIHEDRWLPGATSVHRTVTLAELSRTTGITRLAVEQPDPATHDGRQIGADFVAARGRLPGPTTLAAGERLRVTLWGEGFPTGTTTGQIVISGDQLAQPIVVPFEVRTRLFDYYIFPIFWLAGVIGWLVRRKLKDLEAWRTVEDQLAPLEVRVRREIASNPILTERSGLEQALRAVRTTLDDRKLNKVQEAVDALRSKLDAARAARTTYINERLPRLAALREAITRRWDLTIAFPPDLIAVVDGCEQALLEDRPRDADERMAAVIGAIDTVGGAGTTWLTGATLGLATFASGAAARVPAAARDEAAARLTDATALVKAVPGYDPISRPEAGTYLAALHNARRAVRALGEPVALALAAEATSTTRALGAAGADPALVQRVASLANATHADDPALALDSIGTAVSALHAAVDGFVTKPAAKALVTSGNYAEAVRLQHAEPDDDGGEEGLPLSFELPAAVRRTLPAAERAPGSVRLVPPPPADPVRLARARLRAVRIVRTLAAGVLLSLTAWAALRGSWTGTVGDFLKVGALAFFTDFTLDAVIEAVTKLRPPATPAT